MKMGKKVTAGIISATMALIMCAGTASAAISCQNATVLQVGQIPGEASGSNSGYKIMLQCNDANTWLGGRSYYLTTDLGEPGYATMLTAMSLDRPVKVYLSSYTALSLIETVSIIPAAQ